MTKIFILFIQILTFLIFNLLTANPIQFYKDQVNYKIHSKQISQNTFEKFHSLFIDYYGKTFEEMGVKRSYPLNINLYSDIKSFQADTRLPTYTAAMYESNNSEFYFLLSPRTINEERLITLISHESCHAAFHSTEYNNSARISLEEGFCFYYYPSEFSLMTNNVSYCNLSLEKFLAKADKNLYGGNKSKREEVYLISSRFIQYLLQKKKKEEVLQILKEKEYLTKLKQPWKEFSRICLKRGN